MREKLDQWLCRQQEGGSRLANFDIINYIQVIYAKMEIELLYNDLVEKRRARHSDIESSSSSKTTGGLGMYWWRGGRLSRKLFNCKVLPRSFVTKAARQAGFRKIPGILYPENSDFAKRSRCVAWRAAVEMSTSVDQLALQVRELYSNIRWHDIENNHPLHATALYKLVAERGPWSSLSRWALEAYLKGDVGKAYMLYSRMAEMGYEVAQSNAAWILDKYGERSMCMGESGLCTDAERHQRAYSLWWQASEQGNEHAALLIGDAYYYGRGTVRDYDRAAEAYMHAKSQSNAQAMFNLGYMHEHGQGLPLDLHLAKRYYDEALVHDPAAKLPVTLALTSLWVRMNHADSILVQIIDSLPDVYPKLEAWVENVLLEEGNATILTLFACLLTVLYLRERQRQQAAVVVGEVAQPNLPNELAMPAPMR
ncbi:unnamed protein product [Vicia faba]|uniref:ERAD-associated E3 ubiquitin-protein ligase component HRD3A n=1 Tax=Vicia faba TaxID=3906 RepID=A0AAV1AHM0_VICFA|nr:unnamed protein product [Vicia faba]